jgi:hypothetical protein
VQRLLSRIDKAVTLSGHDRIDPANFGDGDSFFPSVIAKAKGAVS